MSKTKDYIIDHHNKIEDLKEKINKLLKEKEIYIEKHYNTIENKFFRVKKVETHPNGEMSNIYLVYDTPMIPNVLHGYEYATKEEEGLSYLLGTLEERLRDPIGLFYCWKWLDKLTVKRK